MTSHVHSTLIVDKQGTCLVEKTLPCPRISSFPCLPSVGAVLQCDIVITTRTVKPSASHIDLSLIVDGHYGRSSTVSIGALITGYPQLLAVAVVLNSGNLTSIHLAIAFTADDDIAMGINMGINPYAMRDIVSTRRTVIASLPELSAVAIVFHSHVIVLKVVRGRSTGDICVPIGIHNVRI